MDPDTIVDPERSSGADSQAWVKCSRCYRPYDSAFHVSCPTCSHVPAARRCARCQKPTTERTLCQDCASWCFNQKAKTSARIAGAENIGVESKGVGNAK